MSRKGQEFEYARCGKKVGEDAAKQGCQSTGAYYPDMEAGVAGAKAFCRRIRLIVPGGSIVGEKTLDGDEHIDRLLDGRLFKLFEHGFSKPVNALGVDCSPEERLQEQGFQA